MKLGWKLEGQISQMKAEDTEKELPQKVWSGVLHQGHSKSCTEFAKFAARAGQATEVG